MGLALHQLGLLILAIIALLIVILVVSGIGDLIVEVIDNAIGTLLYGE